MGGRATRMIVAAVVAALLAPPLLAPPLLALLAVSLLEVGDARRAIDEAQAGTGEAVLDRTDTLVDRLQAERDWWMFELLGFSEAVEPGALIDAESPQRTDQAITDLRAAIDDHRDDVGDADLGPLAAAVDGLTDLGEVRRSAEEAVAAPGLGSLAGLPAAEAMTDAYAESIQAILDGADVVISGFDDPGVRHGAELELTASGQLGLTLDLGRELMLAAVGDGVGTPEAIAALAAVDGRWRSELAELEAAPAPYDALVAEHLPDGVMAAVQSHSEQALSSGTVDLNVLLADLEAATTSFGGLESAIAERRADEVQEAIDAARDRERRSLLLAGTALAGLVAVAGVAIALAVSARARPPSGPPSDRADGTQLPPPPRLVSDRY